MPIWFYKIIRERSAEVRSNLSTAMEVKIGLKVDHTRSERMRELLQSLL